MKAIASLLNLNCLVFVVAFNCVEARAGTEIRGGGDAVYCNPEPTRNNYSGLYSLDYFLGSLNPNGVRDLVAVKDTDASLVRIASILDQKVPKLGKSLRGFADLVHNHTDYSQPRIWLAVEKLGDLKDEDLLFGNVENCVSKETNKLDMRQAVSRVFDLETKFIRYYFETQIFEDLEQQGAIQLSFLLVHEWLWDFLPLDRVNNGRLINWLLHSRQLDEMSPEKLTQALKNLGVPASLLGSEELPVELPQGPRAQYHLLESKDGYGCASTETRLDCWGKSIPTGLHAQNELGGPISKLSGGDQHLCAVVANKLKCWGDSSRFGNIEQVAGQVSWLVANEGSTCAVTDGRFIYCQGLITGRLPEPIAIPGGERFDQVIRPWQ